MGDAEWMPGSVGESTAENSDFAIFGRLIIPGDSDLLGSGEKRGCFKAFEEPGLVSLKIACQGSPLSRCRSTIAVNNLAEDRLIDTDGFGELILMIAEAEYLKLQIWQHMAFLFSWVTESIQVMSD